MVQNFWLKLEPVRATSFYLTLEFSKFHIRHGLRVLKHAQPQRINKEIKEKKRLINMISWKKKKEEKNHPLIIAVQFSYI